MAGSLLRDARGRVRLLWRILVFVGVSFSVLVAVGLISPLGGLTGAAAASLLGGLVGGWAALRLDGRGPGALGFHLAPSVPREVAVGTLLGVLLAVLVVGLLGALGGVGWSREPWSLAGWWVGAVSALAFFAVPAAAEEVLLRGYPLQALAEWFGPGAGLVVTSVAFGALHAANPGATVLGVANTGAAGLFLGAVYLRTGSLWWASGVHLGWNWGLGYLADVPVSGLDVVDAPGIRGVALGPDWLGGGGFGPEGSLMATAGFLAAAAACWWGPWLRVEPAAAARRPLAVKAGRTNDGPAPRAPVDE